MSEFHPAGDLLAHYPPRWLCPPKRPNVLDLPRHNDEWPRGGDHTSSTRKLKPIRIYAIGSSAKKISARSSITQRPSGPDDEERSRPLHGLGVGGTAACCADRTSQSLSPGARHQDHASPCARLSITSIARGSSIATETRNIMVGPDDQVKAIDFGIAPRLSSPQPGSRRLTFCQI